MNGERTLLLVGAGGFVGRHVGAAAEAAGVRVVATDRSGRLGTRCDLLDAAAVASCVEAAAPDLVVNMAGAASVAASWDRGADALAVNARGAENLLQAVADIAPGAHVLCVSSAQVYGEPGVAGLPFAEEAEPSPVTPYGESKAALETACERFASERGVRIAVIRAFNMIGPGQAAPFSAAGFAREIAAAELAGADRVALAVGNPDAARDFTDVRDAARALAAVSSAELTGTYNLCSGRAVGLGDLIAELAAATPLTVSVELDRSLRRPADPAVTYGDPARLRRAIGWAPAIPLARTLADMLDWWRARLAPA